MMTGALDPRLTDRRINGHLPPGFDLGGIWEGGSTGELPHEADEGNKI